MGFGLQIGFCISVDKSCHASLCVGCAGAQTFATWPHSLVRPRACAVQLISSDLQSLLRPANIKSAAYAALTATFLGLTASSIVAPVPTLTSIVQGANTPDCITLWRNVGAALLVLPTWTMNLKVQMFSWQTLQAYENRTVASGVIPSFVSLK